MKPFAWSYSALTTYELCPKKYYHLYVAKDAKDLDSSWAADGKVVHDAMKKRVVDKVPLALNLRHFEKIAGRFAAAPGDMHGEMKLAINRQFEPTDYFAPDTWCRVIIDLTIVQGSSAVVVDWKTGKRKDDPTQMALNAAVLSRWMPEVTLFKTVFVWLQSNEFSPRNYEVEEFTGVWNDLLPRVAKIETARKTTDFPASPSKLCGWCPVIQCPHHITRDS